MKKTILFISMLLLIGMAIFIFIKRESSKKLLLTSFPTPIVSTTTTYPTSPVTPQNTPSPSVTFCTPQNLQATLTINHAAGNVYGTATIKNISGKICTILGNNFITAQYDQAVVKNITTEHMENAQQTNFQLAPNQILYSQIHYPNGPQCQSGIHYQQIQFSYAISPTQEITFADQTGSTKESIVACSSPTEKTTIQIWNISTTPITQ